MRNVPVRLISFRRSIDEPKFIYALNDSGVPEIGKYFYKRSNGAFTAIQKILHEGQLKESHPIVESGNNPDYEMPVLPQALINGFKQDGIVNVIMRLP